MPVGDITTEANVKKTIKLMEAQTANMPNPTLATQGVLCYSGPRIVGPQEPSCFFNAGDPAAQSTLCIDGSGTMPGGVFTLWGYLAGSGNWYPIKVNGMLSLAEYSVGLGLVRYAERFLNLGHYDRLYLQLTGIGGTGTTFNAYLTTARTP